MINNKLFTLITAIEIIYLIYMFIYFKTYYSFSHPIEKIIESKLPEIFTHSIYRGKYSNKICKFGKYAIILLSIYLLFRYLFFEKNSKFLKISTKIILVITFLLSLINMNALIYLIPFFLIEIYLLRKLYIKNNYAKKILEL